MTTKSEGSDQKESISTELQIKKAKKVRASIQGLLTRQKKAFEERNENLTIVSLTLMLESINDYEKRFNNLEEHIMSLITELSGSEESDEDEFEISDAAVKFLADYEELKTAILERIEQLKTAPPDLNQTILETIGSTLSNGRSIQLPKLKLPSFSGKFTEWLDFKNEFTSMIISDKGLTDIDKFRYLKSALSDEPKRIISSMEISSENFAKAMDALNQRYDNQALIYRAHIMELLKMQNSSGANAIKCRELLDAFQSHLRALLSLSTKEDLADNLLIHILLDKLDTKTQVRWEEKSDESIPSWDNFAKFLEKHAQTLERTDQAKTKPVATKGVGSKKTSPHTVLVSTEHQSKCPHCNSSHQLINCPAFLSLSPNDRYCEVKKYKVCIRCLSGNHSFNKCRSKCSKCQKRHHTLLHFEAPISQPQPIPSTSHALLSSELIDKEQVLLASATIEVIDSDGNTVPCNAVLDSGSTRHFVSDWFAQTLQVKRTKSNTIVGGIDGLSTSSKSQCTLKFKSRFDDHTFTIQASILPKITGTHPPTPFEIQHWKIPLSIPLADSHFNEPKRIDILIGGGLFWKLLKPERIELGPGLPMLMNTHIGWIVVGAHSIQGHPVHNALLQLDEDASLNELVKQFWEVDALPTDPKLKLSSADQHCEEYYTKTLKRDNNGRYIARLPFKDSATKLGNSYDTAVRRFLALERRLDKDPTTKTMYSNFIKEFKALNHLEELASFDLSQPHYFIPHHNVMKPSSSTTKLRVVFDASCKTTTGVSLNDILHVGPKLQDDLFTLLLRFRLYKFVATTDIQKFYRQIKIEPPDSNFLLILWRDTKHESLKTLRLCTNTYGTAPGAYIAVRSLIQLAEDEKEKFPLGAEILRTCFYVDDAMVGADDLNDLKNKLHELQEILKLGGMALSKYCSNSYEVLSDIPTELQEKFLDIDDQKVIRTLGLIWQPQSDVFKFTYKSIEVKPTISKRTVLSEIARLFDPLGFMCPIITLAKTFYQDLWKIHKLGWDDELPLDLQFKWKQFRSQLGFLKQVSIDRYVMVNNDIKHIDVHGFSDASELAYGACVYISCIHSDDTVTSQLFCAKSKVAPTKTLTIARLELCAALLLVNMVTKLKNEVLVTKEIRSYHYWTDSKIVLHWLNADPHKWNIFVAHRVAKIQEASSIVQWHHVPGDSNPADLITRGLLPQEINQLKLWWNGPDFISEPVESWPDAFTTSVQLDQLDEYRCPKLSLLTSSLEDISRSMHYSVNFRGTRRAFAYVMRFISRCRNPVQSKQEREHILKSNQTSLKNIILKHVKIPTIAEEIQAEEKFIVAIQKTAFHTEYKTLQRNQILSSSSSIISLAPFIDPDSGILRVGGRIQKAKVAYDSKHEILLPKDHPYTNSIMSFYHHYRVSHAGPQSTLTAVRSRYWPVNGLKLARQICRKCVWCFRLQPRFKNQLMGNLPLDRVEPRLLKPFAVTGIDYAGPIVVRHHIRCKQEKSVYLALFICFTTKAVHVELVPDLSTESFLRALRRFIADRGTVAKLYSDNATTFVGACNYLKNIKRMLMDSCNNIEQFCNGLHVEWSFSPPRAPNHNGLTEASIKLLKRIIKSIVGHMNLTEDELRTVAKQAASIINSRPITVLSSDPNDLQPLTPGHFLFGLPPSALPEPIITPSRPDDVNSVKLAQRMSHANNLLWKRFYREYLQLLQPRTKWLLRRQNITPGTVVLLKTFNTDSLHWPIGIVQHTKPDDQGNVRIVTVKTARGTFERGLNGVVVLPLEEK